MAMALQLGGITQHINTSTILIHISHIHIIVGITYTQLQ